MIFVTVGTQEPFDRLVKAIDEIFPQLADKELIVQAPLKNYQPVNFGTTVFINPIEYNSIFDKADLIVSHAGMGTILSALIKKKSLIVMPRLLKYGEHRNEHQLATVRKFASSNYFLTAENEMILKKMILSRNGEKFISSEIIGKNASQKLINSIINFIDHNK